jgi:hypothetical protein
VAWSLPRGRLRLDTVAIVVASGLVSATYDERLHVPSALLADELLLNRRLEVGVLARAAGRIVASLPLVPNDGCKKLLVPLDFLNDLSSLGVDFPIRVQSLPTEILELILVGLLSKGYRFIASSY